MAQSRYEALVSLRDRAVVRGEMDIATATQRLIDAYYKHDEPHEPEQPKGFWACLWAFLREA